MRLLHFGQQLLTFSKCFNRHDLQKVCKQSVTVVASMKYPLHKGHVICGLSVFSNILYSSPINVGFRLILNIAYWKLPASIQNGLKMKHLLATLKNAKNTNHAIFILQWEIKCAYFQEKKHGKKSKNWEVCKIFFRITKLALL